MAAEAAVVAEEAPATSMAGTDDTSTGLLRKGTVEATANQPTVIERGDRHEPLGSTSLSYEPECRNIPGLLDALNSQYRLATGWILLRTLCTFPYRSSS